VSKQPSNQMVIHDIAVQMMVLHTQYNVVDQLFNLTIVGSFLIAPISLQNMTAISMLNALSVWVPSNTLSSTFIKALIKLPFSSIVMMKSHVTFLAAISQHVKVYGELSTSLFIPWSQMLFDSLSIFLANIW
jgi:hypothetical protein